MDLLDLTLPTPEENLALDEALLDAAETTAEPRETLRLWEAGEPFVVVGRNSQVAAEVHLDACRQRSIPVLRRTSGGAAIVAGCGSLMYAVVLSYQRRPELRMLDQAHRFVLDTQCAGLRTLVPSIEREGTSDLALDGAKISGNSMRCRRRSLLYHGTLLYDFQLALVDECLAMPPRQPDYRRNRPHRSFLTNLPANVAELRRALVDAWQAQGTNRDWPRFRVQELVATQYSRNDWNFRR